jgi:hypothetical protein
MTFASSYNVHMHIITMMGSTVKGGYANYRILYIQMGKDMGKSAMPFPLTKREIAVLFRRQKAGHPKPTERIDG